MPPTPGNCSATASGPASVRWSPAGLFLTVAAVLAALAAFIAWRLRVIAEAQLYAVARQPTVMVIGESTPAMAQMDPRSQPEGSLP